MNDDSDVTTPQQIQLSDTDSDVTDDEDTCPMCGQTYDHSRTERSVQRAEYREDAMICRRKVGVTWYTYIHIPDT